jgi:hypothetical protein
MILEERQSVSYMYGVGSVSWKWTRAHIREGLSRPRKVEEAQRRDGLVTLVLKVCHFNTREDG